MRATPRKLIGRNGGTRPALMDTLEPRQLLAHGLTGVHFQDSTFREPVGVNIDQRINIGPIAGSESAPDGRRSTRWTGQVVAKFSEFYTFYVQTNGSARLWVNGKLLVEEPNNAVTHEFAGKMTVKFIAGQTYNLQLEYVNRHGDQGHINLLWSSTRTPKQVLPSTRLRSQIKMPKEIQISFRPTTADQPGTYLVDNGLVFGSRGQGLNYGWDQNNTAGMFERNSPFSHSERYDAGALMMPNGQSRSWRINVPNGTYQVRLIAGDPDSTTGWYSLDVEGKRIIRGRPSALSRWYEGETTVSVTDGDIRLTNGEGSNLSRINFIEITPARESDRIIAFHPIALTSDNPSLRWVHPSHQNGWNTWVAQNVIPEIAAGYTRIQLHNPFGVSTTNRNWWELDAYLQAKAAGLTWLTDEFVSAFKPVTDQGIEVIVYLGIATGPEFGTTEAQWMARFWEAMQPLLDANVSIAFDATCLQSEQSHIYKACQLLQARDVKVYMESRPMRFYPHWANFPTFNEEGWWHHNDPDQNPTAVGMRNDQIAGEVLRWVYFAPAGQDPNDPSWRLPQMQRVLREGHTLAIYPSLHLNNVTINWLLARANGYIGAIA